MRRVQRFASGITAFLFECTPNGNGNGIGMGTGYLIVLAIVSDCEMKQNELHNIFSSHRDKELIGKEG
jgi:hypothetical protein